MLGNQPCQGITYARKSDMLGSQRALFDIPADVCWLNAAAYSPLPRASQEAGKRGIDRKVRPWEMEAGSALGQFERARTAAARLIHADPDDVALIPSVSYGVATAGRVLPLTRGRGSFCCRTTTAHRCSSGWHDPRRTGRSSTW